ncbi:MAG: hypothetical protein AAB897_00820 [Patescibacteria group bacterium]
MKFPHTIIDAGRERLQSFEESLKKINLAARASPDRHVKTGTTVVAFVSKDGQVGVIASDGRISMGTISFKEEYRKIFSCRIGFVGVAGSLTMVQLVMPNYRLDLNNFCDGRNRLVTASGAVHRLFQYYLRAAQQEEGQLELLPLFWDFEEKQCRLYALAGMCHVRMNHACAIGSGVGVNGLDIDRQYTPTNSKSRLIANARKYIIRASAKDGATNRHIFYGIIDKGKFDEKEEVL